MNTYKLARRIQMISSFLQELAPRWQA
ncbi:hypothetical protein RSAG8_06161, partial [Rhizoctonia solani AG-8 WAC10335]